MQTLACDTNRANTHSIQQAIAILFLSVAAVAQSPLGTVTGLALDPSGAPVAAAAVLLVDVDTGIEHKLKTNASGVYSVPDLTPGHYRLSSEAAGFQNFETVVFQLSAFQVIRQDLKFQLTTGTTAVTVSDNASGLLQIDSPAINLGLNRKQILELPTNVRSIYDNSGDSGLTSQILPLTIPGVVEVGSGAAWLVPGSGANGVKLKVDGIETNFGNFGEADPVSQPSMESVEEFTAYITTAKAEFGGQGTITTVTRSGTNQLHSDVFWYARNSFFDARNPFYLAQQGENLHDFGASGGGPLVKNKTFLFGTAEFIRGVQSYPTPPTAASVPSLAYRQGNFAGTTLKVPGSASAAYAEGVVPASVISVQALTAQQLLFPLPNYGGGNLLAGNYRASYNGPESQRIVEGRVDHNFSERNSAFVRYEYKYDDYVIPGARSVLPPSSVGTSTNIRTVEFATLGDVYTFTPAVVNEFRTGLVVLSSRSFADLKGQTLLTEIGIQGLPDRTGINGIPNFSISGFSTVTQSLLNPVNDGHAQLSDNLSWVTGKHSLKFGAEYINWFDDRYLTTNSGLFGSYSFTGQYTGNAYADFLLGLPTSVTRVDPYQAQYNRFWDLDAFAEDDFKVTPRLSLSYGLRYEYNSPVTAGDSNIYSFDLTTGAVLIPDARARQLFSPYFPANIPVEIASEIGLPKSLRKADLNNFAPRFGFSYQLDKDARTVIRGGWGVYYEHFSADLAAFLATGPYSFATSITNPKSTPAFTLTNPFASAGSPGSITLNAIAPDLRVPYNMQTSLSVEHELGKNVGVRLSYIGTAGRQLVYQRNVNQPLPSTLAFAQARRPYPLYNNINYASNGADSSYNALQATVSKRLSRGYLFSSAFTWAKELSEVDDTGDSEVNTIIENAYNRRRDRANLYSVPHYQWENQALYEVPFGHSKWYGGWQANLLLNVASGNWLNPQFAGVDPSDTNTVGGRPDVVAPLSYPQTLSSWFSSSTFAAPPANAGRFGNSGRNIIQGPGYLIANFGLSKTFTLERFGRLQLSASFQNVLNHVNFGQPTLASTTPPQNGTGVLATGTNAGVISSTAIFLPAGSPRTGLLGLRYSF